MLLWGKFWKTQHCCKSLRSSCGKVAKKFVYTAHAAYKLLCIILFLKYTDCNMHCSNNVASNKNLLFNQLIALLSIVLSLHIISKKCNWECFVICVNIYIHQLALLIFMLCIYYLELYQTEHSSYLLLL